MQVTFSFEVPLLPLCLGRLFYSKIKTYLPILFPPFYLKKKKKNVAVPDLNCSTDFLDAAHKLLAAACGI